MKSEPANVAGMQFHRPGTIIGKALEPIERRNIDSSDFSVKDPYF